MSCLNKLLDAYKEVCRYNDASVNADSLFSYFEYAVEESDPDEFHLCDSTTYETNTIEISDPDEFCLSEKIINNDNMLMTQTRHTYTIETSDEDEFLLM